MEAVQVSLLVRRDNNTELRGKKALMAAGHGHTMAAVGHGMTG